MDESLGNDFVEMSSVLLSQLPIDSTIVFKFRHLNEANSNDLAEVFELVETWN